jgi:anthranilate synthase/aminodeoxychorismate synthase-like glutamine amidotransferase
MLFVLDNYDSFTYNLVQYLGELGADPVVYRNDALGVDDVVALQPTAVVLSPGPCTPSDAGILVPLVTALAGRVPMLGVCLGHQAIGQAFGGKVIRAERLMHGKTCDILHERDALFDGIPSPLTGMRYHSLVVEARSLPGELKITAWSADRPKGTEIMAMRHREHPIFGVQFHPESIGTEHGKRLLQNFLRLANVST